MEAPPSPYREPVTYSAVLNRMWELYKRMFDPRGREVLVYSAILWGAWALVDFIYIPAASAGLNIAATIVTGLMTASLADEYYFGDEAERHRRTSLATSRIGALVGMAIVTSVLVVLGLFLLVVPGLILMSWWGLYQAAIVRENSPAFESLGRSKDLMSGHTGMGIGVWLTAVALAVAGMVFTIPFDTSTGFTPHLSLPGAIIGFVGGTLLYPVLPIAAAAMYDLLLADKQPPPQTPPPVMSPPPVHP